MKKRILLLLCLAATVQASFAQNTEKSIRQRYNEMKEQIAFHTGSNLYDGADFGEYYHVESRQWLPATGGHIDNTYLYYGYVEGEERIYERHYLKFATKKYNFAARDYYEEYLYDPDGNVAFIYAFDGMTRMEDEEDFQQYEFRFYLNKGRLIKAIVKNRPSEDKPFKEVWTGTKLKSLYTGVFNNYMGEASALRTLFTNIEKEAYNYNE